MYACQSVAIIAEPCLSFAGGILRLLKQLRPEFMQLLAPHRQLIGRHDCAFISKNKTWQHAALFVLSDLARIQAASLRNDFARARPPRPAHVRVVHSRCRRARCSQRPVGLRL